MKKYSDYKPTQDEINDYIKYTVQSGGIVVQSLINDKKVIKTMSSTERSFLTKEEQEKWINNLNK